MISYLFKLNNNLHKQKLFNEAIQILRPHICNEVFISKPTINLITKTGKIPVYYSAKKGDFTINDPISEFDINKVDPITRIDYKIIFEELTKFDYLRFIKHYQNSKLN